MMEGPGADSEEKHEPVSDIDAVGWESLKALDPERPIREAEVRAGSPIRGRIRQIDLPNLSELIRISTAEVC
jgi:hypothetical protein